MFQNVQLCAANKVQISRRPKKLETIAKNLSKGGGKPTAFEQLSNHTSHKSSEGARKENVVDVF
jgi:hypothetical protein